MYMSINGPPNLRELTAFPTRHGTVNVAQEIGVHYQTFGVHLLEDPTGTGVANMVHKHRGDPQEINTEILQEWLHRKGRRPVSWRTLIKVLKDIQFKELARDIRNVCPLDVIDIEPSFHRRGSHQQTALTSWYYIAAILLAVISFCTILRNWPEEPLNGYMNVLKGTYEKQPVTDPDHWLHVVMPFTDLTLTEGHYRSVRETQHFMQGGYNPSLVEVVNSIKKGSRILIEGRPGVGKTTLLRHIAMQWVEGKYLQNFLLVVLVRLGHTPSSRIRNLESMLEYHSHGYPDTASIAKELGHTGGEGICFLLDALDEYLPQEDDFIYQLIKHETLPNAAMIVTSRPHASYLLRKHFTRNIEVVGFLEHQIQKYISALPPNSAANVSEYFHQHTNVERISYLPLHLAMVAYLALHSERVSLLDLDTDTKIYHIFVNLTFRQRYKDVDNLDEIHSQAFSALSKSAFDATTRSSHSETSIRLHNLDAELRAKVESFSLLTINKQHEGDRIGEFFTFSHYTFQEFFAAYYLTTLPHEEQMEALEHYQHSSPPMWRFFFGLLRDHSSENTTKLFEKLAHIQYPTLVCTCAYELKQTAIAEVLVQALNHSITVEYIQQPSDCTAIGYVISLNPHQFERLKIGFHLFPDIQEACFVSMHAELPKNNAVVQVTLQTLILSNRTASALVQLVQYFPNLQQLELWHMYVPESSSVLRLPMTSSVVAGLERLKHLRQLKIITSNEFGYHSDTETAMFVVTVLKYLTNLQCLEYVVTNPVGDDGGVANLAESLKHLTSLQTLKLLLNSEVGDDGVTDDGVRALAKSIKCLSSLQTLRMSLSKIGHDGMVALAEGIKYLTSLETLNLAFSRIGDDGVVALPSDVCGFEANTQYTSLSHS